MGFDEARELQKEDQEGKKGKFWHLFKGKYTGTRSLG